MAAGAGRRMGGRPKAMLRLNGEALIARQIRLLRGAGIGRIVVVLGHHAALIEPELQTLKAALDDDDALRWVVNPNPDAGPGSSLRTGLAAVPADASAVMVTLADQPLLQAGDLGAVLRAWQVRPAGIDLLLPQFQGQPGHPLVFGQAVRQAVMAAECSTGVREWRRAHPGRVQALVVDHPRYTSDVDTPGDLQTLAQTHGVRLQWPPGLDGAFSGVSA